MREAIRIQKFLSEQGVASRRKAEAMIEEGRVRVNGSKASLGDKIVPGEDSVSVDGETIAAQQKTRVVLMMNKPKGYVCTHDDPHQDRTIFELIPPPWNRERFLIAGRLDKDSEGLLILSNDGDFIQKVSHPASHVVKRYRVELDKPFDPTDIGRLLNGVTWEGDRLRADKVVPHPGKTADQRRRLEIHMGHGRKREIRRLLYAFGYDVVKLQRFQVGGLTLRGIGPGRVKELGAAEIKRLFN